MKALAQVTVGIRTTQFKDTLKFFSEVLHMELVFCDEPVEFVQLRLPSGELMELFGEKNLSHPFTTSPEWEIMIDTFYASQDLEMTDGAGLDAIEGPDASDSNPSELYSGLRWEDL